jgi:hypothetical protein
MRSCYSTYERKKCLLHVIVPLAVCFGILMSWQATYNHTITGKWHTFPTMVDREKYGIEPTFIFGNLDKSHLSDKPTIRAGQMWSLNKYNELHKQPLRQFYIYIENLIDLLQANRWSNPAILVMAFLLLAILVYPMAGYLCYYAYKKPQYRALALSIIVLTSGSLLVSWINPHYLGFYFAVYLVYLSAVLREWYLQHSNKQLARFIIVAAILLMCVFLYKPGERWLYSNNNPVIKRPEIIAQLQKKGGRHLGFVDQNELARQKIANTSWVYNWPDIDAADIIWAHYLSLNENQKLIDYYPNRKIWYIIPEEGAILIDYSQHLKQIGP